MSRSITEAGKKFIRQREDCKLEPHWDKLAQVWDIGWGHRFKDGEPRVAITQAEADALFDVDMHYYSDQVEAAVLVEIPDPAFDALTSFCYNCGGSALRSSTLLQFLNQGQFSDAALELLEYRKSKGVEIDGLLLRRGKEAVMFAKGVYL